MSEQEHTDKKVESSATTDNTDIKDKTQKKGKSRKSSKKHKKKKKAVLLSWAYDGKPYTGWVVKSKGEYFRPEHFKSESDLDKGYKEIRTWAKKERLKIKEKHLELPIGIERLTDDYDENHGLPELTKTHFQEFKKMIQYSAGVEQRRPVLELVSVILSSYVMRYIAELGGQSDFNSTDGVDFLPMNVSVSENENAFYVLLKICRSVIIRPEGTVKKTPFKIGLPAAIPRQNSEDFEWQGFPDIIDSAWVKVRGCKEKFPVPCRDTAVLFDMRFLRTRDFGDFSRRNPWCSCITYGKKVKSAFGLTMKINGSSLAGIDIGWDERKVNELTQAYAANILYWLRGRDYFPFQDIWLDAGVYLERYLQTHKKERKKLETCFRHKVKLATMISFLRFARKWIHIPDTEMVELQSTILNTLLPGCVPPQPDTPPAQQRPPREVLEEVLNLILIEDNLKHFCLVPREWGPTWPTSTTKGDEVWGYFKDYKWSEEAGEETPCLLILHKRLRELVRELTPELVGFDKVMTSINNSIKSNEKNRPGYIHKTLNVSARFEKEKNKSHPAYRMKIEDLPINEDVKRQLLEMAAADK